MTKIFKLNELDLSKITFSEPNNNIIYTSYNNEHPILFETPELYCVDKINKNKTKYSTHEQLVTLKSRYENDTNMCKNFFEQLDNKLIETGKKNINMWPFNTKFINYTSLIRFIDNNDNGNNRNNEYYENGVIKVKFIRSKKFNTLVFDENKNIVESNNYENVLCGGIYVKMILEIISVWVRDNVYGIYLKLHQLKITNNSVFAKQLYLFDSVSSDNNSNNTNNTNNTNNSDDDLCSDNSHKNFNKTNECYSDNTTSSNDENYENVDYVLSSET